MEAPGICSMFYCHLLFLITNNFEIIWSNFCCSKLVMVLNSCCGFSIFLFEFYENLIRYTSKPPWVKIILDISHSGNYESPSKEDNALRSRVSELFIVNNSIVYSFEFFTLKLIKFGSLWNNLIKNYQTYYWG